MKYLIKTIEYGLYLLVFFLPVQTRWIIKAGELEYATYSLYGTDILLVLAILLFVAYKFLIFNFQLKNFQTKCKIPAWRLISGLIIISAVSVIFAIDKMLALYKLGWLILGAGLFGLVVSANYNRVKLIYAMLAGIFFQAVLGGRQFLNQSNFTSKWLGLALHNGADLGALVIETVGPDGAGERWLRAYGGLDHPNILGGVLALGILLLIGIMNYKLGIRDKMQNIKFHDIKLLTSYFLLLTFLAALFFSFSRAAWLALTLGIGVMLREAVMKKNYNAQKNILQAILISGLVGFILFFQFSNLVVVRVSGNERLEVKSVSERFESLKKSLPIIKKRWAAGVGIGNYTLALSRQEPGKESFYYQPAHNVFLLVWAETGILGLIFFIGLIFVSARRSKASCHCGLDPQSRNLFVAPKLDSGSGAGMTKKTVAYNDSKTAILIALIVMMTFDHWPWSLHFGALFFWLVLGLMVGDNKKMISI